MISLKRRLSHLIVFFALLSSPVFGVEEISASACAPFTLITIPKSGSHMFIKALHLMTGGVSIWHTKFPSFYCIPPEQGFLYTHFCLSPQLEKDYSHLPALKKLITLRDLRDVSISIVHQIQKSPWPGLTLEERNAFLKLPFDEQLLFVINYDYDVTEVAKTAPNSLQVSVGRVAEQAIRYSADPKNLACKYEDLVGPLGGGTLEAQVKELRRIAEYLGIEAPDHSLYDIAAKLYGDEFDPFGKEGFKNYGSTFKKGQIGAWKSVFKPEHKAAFKQKLGKALIQLGYEQDNEW